MISPGMLMDVDLVYTWVNSADTEWAARREAYARREVGEDYAYCAGKSRFQDNGELRYSLRSAVHHLPFIRRIYVVHGGAAPEWLRGDHDRLVLIPQDSILPPEISPSYESNTIESVIHRIPGLAEHYIYSNDDMFFSAPHVFSDLFDDRGRCLIGVSPRLMATWDVNPVYRSKEINSLQALRSRISLPAPYRVWPNCLYEAKKMLGWELWTLYRRLPRVNAMTHVAHPYRKSAWEGFSRLFATEIEVMRKHRFRSKAGLTINAMYHHYLRAQDLAIFSLRHDHVYLDNGTPEQERRSFLEQVTASPPRISRFCLNDTPSPDGSVWTAFLRATIHELFPVPAIWEV